MKKIILPSILILIATSLALFVKSNANKVANDTKNLESQPLSSVSIVAEDLNKIQTKIVINKNQNDLWLELNDYSKKSDQIINSQNKSNYFDLVASHIKDLNSCIKKDFCGIERIEGKAYFDEEKTPAHILLARELEITKSILKIDPSFADKIDWNLVTEISLMKSPIVQNIALDLLRNFDKKNNGAEKLLKMSQDYKGELKAKLFLNLAKDALPDERKILINAFKDSFSNDDADTVISVLEKLKEMKFSKSELLEITPYLCRFKESELQIHNFKVISMHLTRLNLSVKEICP